MNSRAKGIAFIVAAAFFFACMSTCVRLAGDVPTFQKTFFRNLIAVFVAGGMLFKARREITLPKEGRLPLYHFDVYRIEDIDEMCEIGYEECINSDGVCVIEWSENISELIPDDALRITIERVFGEEDDLRKITYERKG